MEGCLAHPWFSGEVLGHASTYCTRPCCLPVGGPFLRSGLGVGCGIGEVELEGKRKEGMGKLWLVCKMN